MCTNASKTHTFCRAALLYCNYHQQLLPKATIVFYSVSGGPFGIEEAVRSAGHFYSLLGCIVFVFVWSLPEAIMTTELGSTFVDAAGGVAWVEHAFGYKAGFMVGYLGWIAGVTDNAIYPVLFLDYVLQGFLLRSSANDATSANNAIDDPSLHPILRFIILTTTTIILSYINWLGLPVVGRMSVIICCVAMSPFLLLTIIGVFQVDPQRWFIRPMEIDIDHMDEATMAATEGGFFPNFVLGNVLWRPFLNSLFWNLNSFDSAASFSEDVENPSVAYPKAMKYAVVMVFCAYIFPLLVALGASDAKQSDWVDGYLATATSNIVGPWLGDWTIFAAGISNIALYQAELSTEAYQLMGMAERGYVPSIFAHRSRHGTPTYAIILGTSIIIILVTLSDLSQLIEMLNFSYAMALLMEYAAFIKLRISHPDMHRPWRLPFNTFGCILLFIPPFLCTIFLLSLATYQTYIFSICVNSMGVLLYVSKERGYWGGESNSAVASIAQSPPKGSYNIVHTDSEMINHHHTVTNGMVLSDLDDDNELEIELS
jgi:amino acid transporter